MFTTTNSFRDKATVMAATVLFSATCIGAAITPAQASTADFKASVERSIDTTVRLPAPATAKGTATLAVSIDANGAVSNVALVKSSGVKNFDREAVRTANAVSYPAGKARTIAMVLGFNQRPSVAGAKSLVTAYRNDNRQLLATASTAQPNG
jgi:TonB family protein